MHSTAALLLVLVALVSLAAAAAIRPATDFPVPATYAVSLSQTITFFANGTFATTTKTVCVAAPCPEAGTRGKWSWQQPNDVVELKATVAAAAGGKPEWHVGQAWQVRGREYAANAPTSVTAVKAALVRYAGKRGKEFPVPQGAQNWRRI
ncbi:hypothetical protein H9P43_001998 [Blastocladiella emersonii ATCC 22665]|nr:hypothetical protein H9P43_001998 [Blastocladiella emersonii ATCC 22665]